MTDMKTGGHNESENRLHLDLLLDLTADDTSSSTVRIGDLAEEFGVSLRTLRFYEDRGLISPTRQGTTRLYSRGDRKRLRFVLLAKHLGFSLTEAKQLIELLEGPNNRRQQLQTALVRCEEQHAVLLEQKRDIDASLHAMRQVLELVRSRIAVK